jgi:Zn-dependent M16 (insulinase) family peptidase
MAFELRRETPVPSIGATYMEYLDPDSGAKHIHLRSPSTENSFMVSFATVPHSDDGRAHILEHLSLCGSSKYPTRDPFFSMNRRSLATFMNAMTYADRTVYPFATQDRQDYFNLLDVYLDAAFFPRLDPLDFQQEGWRLSFDEQGKLGYNGVVFNEMKEPSSSPQNALWHALQKAMKPGTTYSFDSGGDPLAIPTLTHQDLVEFHHTHYHPSRAVFWSYGDIDPADVQSRIQSEVISRISTRLDRVEPDAAPLPTTTRKLDIRVPSQGAPNEHALQVAWHIGESARDLDVINDWQIFSQAVAGDSASPLMMALEGAGFGRPGMVGVESGTRQATFLIGMDGLAEREIPKARELIYSTLESIAQEGIAHARLESVVRDFELESKEIRGGSTPHGLRALLSMVHLELNGGDPLRAIDVQADLDKASADIANPDFIKRMARTLLSSQARVEARVIPDESYLPARAKTEADALEAIQRSLTPIQASRIKQQNEDLLARQRAKMDVSSLPKIEPSQVSRDLHRTLPVAVSSGAGKPTTALVEAATNGVAYFTVVVDASRTDPADSAWLSLGASLATSLGFGDLGFEQADVYRSERGSSFSAMVEASPASKASQSSMALRLRYSARCLERESGSMAEALCKTLSAPRFDEHDRIAFLIQSDYQETIQNIAQSGAGLASTASTSGFAGLGAFSASVRGLSHLRFMETLDAMSRSPEGLAQLQAKLESVFKKLSNAPFCSVFVGAREASERCFSSAQAIMNGRPSMPSLDSVEFPIAALDHGPMPKVALHGPGQLNYCHAAWAGPRQGDPDCGPMLVLSAFLRNTFLHRALREEGGAYGGSASMSAAMGCFTMSSYRDPRVEGTYGDFQKAIASAVHGSIESEDLDEAIISIMKSLEKIGTPHEQAATAVGRLFSGVEDAERLALRRSILDCTADDLRRVARVYLDGKPHSQAAYVCPKSAAEADGFGLLKQDVLSTPTRQPAP